MDPVLGTLPLRVSGLPGWAQDLPRHLGADGTRLNLGDLEEARKKQASKRSRMDLGDITQVRLKSLTPKNGRSRKQQQKSVHTSFTRVSLPPRVFRSEFVQHGQCQGMDMAIFEAKVAAVQLLRHLEFDLAPGQRTGHTWKAFAGRRCPFWSRV